LLSNEASIFFKDTDGDNIPDFIEELFLLSGATDTDGL
jgi:hypothetical protein